MSAPGSGGRLRDPFSAISHYVGAALSLIGVGVLLNLSAGRPIAILAFLIYGSSLLALYTASGVYHSVISSPPILQKIDHGAIYLLIAGTYTPICLLGLPRELGYLMLAAQAGLAAIGIGALLFFGGGPKWLRLVLYLLMGWMVLFLLRPLSASMPAWAVGWLVAGGLIYSVGTIVYATKRPTLWPGKFDSHDLWHLFVMAGSAAHYISMFGLPIASVAGQ